MRSAAGLCSWPSDLSRPDSKPSLVAGALSSFVVMLRRG